MRLSFIAATVLGLQISTFAYSQKEISLSVKMEPLRNVLKLIEKESDYRFLYKENPVFETSRVTVQVDKAGIEDVLKEVLAGTGLNYTISPKDLVVLRVAGVAEAFKPITGVVKNEKGEPMADVTVTVKKTLKATSTNAKGEFSIDANSGDKLVFSSVGYAPPGGHRRIRQQPHYPSRTKSG